MGVGRHKKAAGNADGYGLLPPVNSVAVAILFSSPISDPLFARGTSVPTL